MDLAKRRQQNLSSPRQDARGVTPSVRSFTLAIDRQRQGLERIPVLAGSRPDLVETCRALDEAEVAALAFSLDEPAAELVRMQEAARAVSVPVLRTDLLIEEFQIYQSRVAGADAVLLRFDTVPFELLARMAQAAKSTHMAACIACSSAEQVTRAGELRPAVIAVPPALVAVPLPPRSFLLALSGDRSLRGRVDAVLDPALSLSADPAAAFRAALALDDSFLAEEP